MNVGRIFDLGANHKSHAMKSSEFSKTELFAGQRYRRMKDQKPLTGLALNQDFARWRGLQAIVKM